MIEAKLNACDYVIYFELEEEIEGFESEEHNFRIWSELGCYY